LSQTSHSAGPLLCTGHLRTDSHECTQLNTQPHVTNL